MAPSGAEALKNGSPAKRERLYSQVIPQRRGACTGSRSPAAKPQSEKKLAAQDVSAPNAKGSRSVPTNPSTGGNLSGKGDRRAECGHRVPNVKNAKPSLTAFPQIKPAAKGLKVHVDKIEGPPRKEKDRRPVPVGSSSGLIAHTSAKGPQIVADHVKVTVGPRQVFGQEVECDRHGKTHPNRPIVAVRTTQTRSRVSLTKSTTLLEQNRLANKVSDPPLARAASPLTAATKAAAVNTAAWDWQSVRDNVKGSERSQKVGGRIAADDRHGKHPGARPLTVAQTRPMQPVAGSAIDGTKAKGDRMVQESNPPRRSSTNRAEMSSVVLPAAKAASSADTALKTGFECTSATEPQLVAIDANVKVGPPKGSWQTGEDDCDGKYSQARPIVFVQTISAQSDTGLSATTSKRDLSGKENRPSGQSATKDVQLSGVDLARTETAVSADATLKTEDRRPLAIKQKLEDTYERGLKILQINELEVLRAERDAYVKAYRQAEGERKFLVRHVQGAGMSAAKDTPSLSAAQLEAELESCLNAAIAEDVAVSARHTALIDDLRGKLEDANEHIGVLEHKLALAVSRQGSDAAKIAEQNIVIKGLTRLLAESQEAFVNVKKHVRRSDSEPWLQAQDSGIDVYNSASQCSSPSDCDTPPAILGHRPAIPPQEVATVPWILSWNTNSVIFGHPFL
ncbi:hypothetical protein HDU86_006466 [Geranomyces michiganensis]|nr:hypothetical protein HDU86_006466 [Geranomyces michiganensis]